MAATRRLAELTRSIKARAVWPDGALVVALSGGADSAALAALAPGSIRLAHVNHGWPGSGEMEMAARMIASALELPLDVHPLPTVPENEGSARTERYRVLLDDLVAGDWLLTGHTRDDQAETVLAHLLRGSGTLGLAGIPRQRQAIWRPLLDVRRSETRELATLLGLPWRDDPSNEDSGPTRNRIRNWLLPTLEAEFNPAVRDALVNAARAFSTLETHEPVGEEIEGGWRMARSVLWAAGPEEAARMLRASLRSLNNGYGLDQDECDRVWEVVSGRTRATELRGRMRVESEGPWLVCRESDHNLGR